MIKIYLPNTSKMSIGGGWTFRRSLTKGLQGQALIVDNPHDCNVILITGATMTDRTEIKEAKKAGKKIVFRIDNMPKDSNNRGTAFSRMRDFAEMADWIIFQSKWAKDYVGWWLQNLGIPAMQMGKYGIYNHPPGQSAKLLREGFGERATIIYNGVDKEVFNYSDNPKERRGQKYLYVRYNRDENKRFPEAALYFHRIHRKDPSAELVIVGKFSPEMIEYDFDFFAGEKVIYHLPVENPAELASIMRDCKYILFPNYADASPNTLAEALACGLEPLLINQEGGTKEVLENYLYGGVYSIQEMATDYLKVFTNLI